MVARLFMTLIVLMVLSSVLFSAWKFFHMPAKDLLTVIVTVSGILLACVVLILGICGIWKGYRGRS